jgi:hypothetical protein
VNYNYTSSGFLYPLTNEDGEVDDENLLVRIVELGDRVEEVIDEEYEEYFDLS